MAARSPEIPWKSNLAPPPTSAHIIPAGERCSVNISRLLTPSNKTSPTLHRGGVSRRSRWPTKVCNSSMDFEMPRLSLVFCTWRDTISHTHGETDGQRHARIHVRLMLHFPRRGNVDLWRRLKTGNKSAIFRMNFHYERYTITRSSKLRRAFSLLLLLFRNFSDTFVRFSCVPMFPRNLRIKSYLIFLF